MLRSLIAQASRYWRLWATCIIVAPLLMLPTLVSSAQSRLEVSKVDQGYRLVVDQQVVATHPRNIQSPKAYDVPQSTGKAVTWTVAPGTADEVRSYWYAVKIGDRAWTEPRQTTYNIRLKNREFDPTQDVPHLPGLSAQLRAREGTQLFLVQFQTQVLEEYRQAIRDLGGQFYSYIPELTHLVLMKPDLKDKVAKLQYVRAVVPMEPYYKAQRAILDALPTDQAGAKTRYVIVALSKEHQKGLAAKLKGMMALTEPGTGTDQVGAELTSEQLRNFLADDSVLWVERATKPEKDMDHARIQGGADFLGMLPAGYTGVGIRGHIMEGIYKDHSDFKANSNRQAPIPVNDSTPDGHGTNTFGEVFGDGTGQDPKARGLLPNGQGLYTNYNFVSSATPGSTALGSRYELVGRLIKEHRAMFQTASWGYAVSTQYDARSKEMDDLIFDHDIPITQSQSNTGTQTSRPQAWAKNIISVGGAYHFNTENAADDRWNNGASVGPASDRRIKPDLCAYYDQINTADGPSGYTSTFGGTSGATPIVAGHVGLCLEMWTNGVFGNPLPKPPKPEFRFENRPHFTTVKALLICSARQYEFPPKTDLDRVRQGWGFPDLKALYEYRSKAVIVNQADVLKNLESKLYTVTVKPGEPTLRVCMVYADPGANPAAGGHHRINNLDLKVSDPDGQVYWGNNGLLQGIFSQPGGVPDNLNTVENVFVQNPKTGQWKVEVIAAELNVDSHKETPELDADYALVILGVVP